MDEYIEREALYEKLHEAGGCDAPKESCADGYDKGITEAIKILNEAPAADVVEVVRCKDCKYYEHPEYYHYNGGGTKDVCRTFKRQMQADDFCSYGERKDGAS